MQPSSTVQPSGFSEAFQPFRVLPSKIEIQPSSLSADFLSSARTGKQQEIATTAVRKASLMVRWLLVRSWMLEADADSLIVLVLVLVLDEASHLRVRLRVRARA